MSEIAVKEREETLVENVNENIKLENQMYKLKVRQKIYAGIKSFIDWNIAFVALIVLVPVFLIVGVAIKIDSKGPVFFSHKRIGKHGKEFYCIKFRSMTTDARHDVAGYEYEEVTSHITKVGKFIRKTSIDELPQLFNVICGKMSLIGYRPSQKSEITLNRARESYNLYQIKPGITGWAQVNGRDELAAKPVEKAKYDAYYLKNFSLFLDIKILFKTVKQIVCGDSEVREGIVDNKTKDVTENE